jgi:hypothetical protein
MHGALPSGYTIPDSIDRSVSDITVQVDMNHKKINEYPHSEKVIA